MTKYRIIYELAYITYKYGFPHIGFFLIKKMK